MPSLNGSVGQAGLNKKHDVALVQVMLRFIKNPKAQPYLTVNYDGVFSPGGATFKAIKAFQADQKTTAGPPPEPSGKIELTGKTFLKMAEMLPATHKNLRALEGHKLVYLPSSQADANAAAARVSSDTNLTADFKANLSALITAFFQKYGIVLSPVPGSGGFRTFQKQRELMDERVSGKLVTFAGPGESNHNWGNGADLGFDHFTWLQGDGTTVNHPNVTGAGDTLWLHVLSEKNAGAFVELWQLRNRLTTLHPSAKKDDWVHLQSFSDDLVSMGISLAVLLDTKGYMWWEFKDGAYWCNYGLADRAVKFKVGTAKGIWDKAVNVDETSLATAINQAITRRAAGPLPDNEEAIYAAVTGLTKSPPKVWGKSDIKKDHCDLMRVFFRDDFEIAEKNYTLWKPYDKKGAPM